MRLNDLKKRENYDRHLHPTLQALFESYDETLRVDDERAEGHDWYYHAFFGVYATPKLQDNGRRFLFRAMRHTPHFARKAPQWLAAAALHQPRVFAKTLHYAFSVHPRFAHADACMIMPGNQRMRLFNFETNTCRVQRKHGFSKDCLVTEIEARRALAPQFDCVEPVLKAAEDGAYFDESLLPHSPLNRWPKKRLHADFWKTLRKDLHAIALTKEAALSGTDYAEQCMARLGALLPRLTQKFAGLETEEAEQLWAHCARICREAQSIDIGFSHGDFQAGNVLLHPENDDFSIIDWEDAGCRFAGYDAMCYALGARSTAPRLALLHRYVKWGLQHPLLKTHAFLRQARRHSLAAFLLEDWIWLLEVSTREGITQPTDALLHRLEESQALRFF